MENKLWNIVIPKINESEQEYCDYLGKEIINGDRVICLVEIVAYGDLNPVFCKGTVIDKNSGYVIVVLDDEYTEIEIAKKDGKVEWKFGCKRIIKISA